VGFHAVAGEVVGGGEDLGQDGAHADEGDRGMPGRLAEAVTAAEDVLAPPLPPDRVGGDSGERLVHGPGGQPEVGGGTALAAEAAEGVEEGPLEVLSEGRFPGDAAGLLEADGRRDDRLVGAAFRGEGD